MRRTKFWKKSLLLLVVAMTSGCVSEKLNGFQEITARHPAGLEHAVSTDEGEAFVRDLGKYINELERRIEGRD